MILKFIEWCNEEDGHFTREEFASMKEGDMLNVKDSVEQAKVLNKSSDGLTVKYRGETKEVSLHDVNSMEIQKFDD